MLEKAGTVLRGMREAAGLSLKEVGEAINLKDPSPAGRREILVGLFNGVSFAIIQVSDQPVAPSLALTASAAAALTCSVLAANFWRNFSTRPVSTMRVCAPV